MPFADMVLLSCNSATGILSSTLISICLLGERFDNKYHTSALGLIIVGNTLTVIQTNKEQRERDAEDIAALLLSK